MSVRAALPGALNGVLEDYVVAPTKPLAITMRLRRGVIAVPRRCQPLAMAIRQTRGKLGVLLYGLCMNDLLSKRKGHEAPLDRGNWGDMPLSTSAYCAPLARQDTIRSAGILDLGFGNPVDDEC